MTPAPTTRRTFIKQGSAAMAGATLLSAPGLASSRPEPLRIALVGCGGRGAGAASQALSVSEDVKLVAMADAFSDRLESTHAEIAKRHPERLDVPPERRHVGFDAYEKAITDDIDVVILATPPGFRPLHFEHAVSLGKHVFMEKPVAVDAPGVRRVLAAAKDARAKNLKVGVGLQRHHSARYQETVKRIQDGEIGDPLLLRCYWNSGGVWTRARKPGMTEMEYQMRNWYYFNWLCGDHIVEQHIHNLDVCNWIMGGYPVRAQGQGGRQVRTGLDTGEIYDHHMVEFTYSDGTTMLSQCRHQQGTWSNVSEHVQFTGGSADVGAGILRRKDGSKWRWKGEQDNPYQVEHDRLFAAIREDTPHDEAEYGALSTMTSIFGRMATYSGKEITWDEALASDLDLAPERYAWDAAPRVLPDDQGFYPVPTPGATRAL